MNAFVPGSADSIFIGSERHPLFRADANGISVFAEGESTEWDEKNEQWLVTRTKFQPLLIPWHKMEDAAAGPAERTPPGEPAPKTADAVVIRLEVEPSVNLSKYFFSDQGYTKADLIGLSREEWDDEDLFSQIRLPARQLPCAIDETVERLNELKARFADESREYQMPEPTVKRANPLTKWLLRRLGKMIKD